MEKFHNIEKHNLEEWYKCFAIRNWAPPPSHTHKFSRGLPFGLFVLREKASSPMVMEV